MMKKIVSLFLVSLAVLTLISCGKKEITTNEQARAAFVAAYEKQNEKNGGLMDVTFDFATTMEGVPIELDGTMSIGYTIKPEFSAEMNMTVNTDMMGMQVELPFQFYYEVEGSNMTMYFNAMNTWMKTSVPYSQFDIAAMRELNVAMLETIDEVILKGKTEINETPVYELEVTMGDNTFSKMLEVYKNVMSDAEVQVLEEAFKTVELSVEEIDLLFAGLTIPTYLRQSDLSLYGCSIDIEQFLGQVLENATEIAGTEVPPEVLSELDMSGFMTFVYKDGEPTGVYTVPQEARDAAVDMNVTEQMTF